MDNGAQAQLLKSLGGGTKVAAKLLALTKEDVKLQTMAYRVLHWKKNDHIPWRWRPWIALLADGANDVTLPEDFLGPARGVPANGAKDRQ